MKRLALAAILVLAAGSAFAQAPRVVNAALQQRAVAGPLDPSFQSLVREQAGPGWIAYSVPAVPGHRSGCCGDGQTWSRSPCYLEGRPAAAAAADDAVVRLEGDAALLVLFRVENRQVGRIAVFSPDCQLDAGGLSFVSLTGVAPADSVRLLAGFARTQGLPDRVAHTALTALALHADAAADTALQDLLAAREPLPLRTRAAFWLGSVRGNRGYEILQPLAEGDPSAQFRKQATLALSQSAAPGAIDTLIRMAKGDASGEVRGQALFWLAQKAGRRAAGVITEAIANDPESQVKERAVFALSRLPADEGVPLLIGVARTNRDPNVRKRAMFWLGQSKDARAIAFFEEVLKTR